MSVLSWLSLTANHMQELATGCVSRGKFFLTGIEKILILSLPVNYGTGVIEQVLTKFDILSSLYETERGEKTSKKPHL